MCASCAARRRVGVVTGLAMEAKIISKAANDGGHHHPHLEVAGPGAPEAQDTVDRLINQGAEAILSFGLAGGLDPRIPAGALLVPEGVLLPQDGSLKVLETDRKWRMRLVNLLSSGINVREDPLLCSMHPVLGVADKAKLHRDSEAGAVDMESAPDSPRRLEPWRSVPGIAGRVGLCRHCHPGRRRRCHDPRRSSQHLADYRGLGTGHASFAELLHLGQQSHLASRA